MEIIGKNDPKHIMKRIQAFVMSDGYYVKSKGSSNIHCRLTTIHEEFAEYFAEVVKPITSTKIIECNDKSCKQGFFYTAYTPVHPKFTAWKPRIYNNNYRGIDEHALKLLDWEMFAIMYQCDGTIGKMGTGRPSGMKLCTDRLTHGDALHLASIIRERLNISAIVTSYGKYKYRISFYSKDFYKIFSGIKPYMCKCFNYKVPNDEILEYYKERYTSM